MKPLKVTEAQLRAWRPCRPSVSLRQKAVSPLMATPSAQPTPWLWGCLTPAMVCVLLMFSAFNHHGDAFGSKQIVSMVLSNQNDAAYSAGGQQTAENRLASVTFEWTNRSSFKSIDGFTPTTNFSN